MSPCARKHTISQEDLWAYCLCSTVSSIVLWRIWGAVGSQGPSIQTFFNAWELSTFISMMSSGKPKHSRVGARGMFSLGCAKALGSIPRLTQGKKSRVSILTLSVYSQVGPHFSQGVSKMWRFFCISMPYREEHTFSTQFSEIPFSLELYAPVERLKESSVQQKRLEGEWGTPSTSCNKTVCWGHHVQVQSSLLGCSFLSLFVVSSQMSLHSACAPPHSCPWSEPVCLCGSIFFLKSGLNSLFSP